jgi:hypothetical protein
MRPLVFHPAPPTLPVNAPVVTVSAGNITWTDPTPALDAAGTASAATKGNTDNEIGFRVERLAFNNNTATVPAFAALAPAAPVVDGRVNTLANATAFKDVPAAFTDYSYKVVAVNEGGDVSSAAVTLAQAPAAPTGLLVTPGVGLPSNVLPVTLKWTDVATNEDGYAITGAVAGSTPVNSSSFAASTAPTVAGTVLSFNAAATKAGFANSAPATASLTVVPVLSAPTAFAAVTNAVAKTAVLTWVDQAFAETGYQLKRATVTINARTGLPVAAVAAVRPTATTVLVTNATTVTDTALAANTLYQYQIFPMNGLVASTTPASLYATTAVNLGAPPSQLQASGAPTATSIGFQWQAALSPLATGYEIQYCVGTAAVCKVAAATAWAPVPGTMTAGANAAAKFTMTGLTGKTTYSFRMRAVNTLVPKVLNGEPGLTSTTWSPLFSAKTL